MKRKSLEKIKKTKKKPFVPLTPLEASHEIARGLYKLKMIDEKTMREFDVRCLPKVKDLSATEIKKIRRKEKLSQAVFAHYLNTSASTVRQWEIGAKHPRGTSLKLLNLVHDKGISVLT